MPFLTFTLCRPACKALDSRCLVNLSSSASKAVKAFGNKLVISLLVCAGVQMCSRMCRLLPSSTPALLRACRLLLSSTPALLRTCLPATLINPSSAKYLPPAFLINPSSAKDVPPALLITPGSAKDVPPATLINPNSAQDVPSAVCVSPSSAEEGNDEGSLAVADSETGSPPAAIPNNVPLMPTFAICDGIQNMLTRYTFFWALERPSLSS